MELNIEFALPESKAGDRNLQIFCSESKLGRRNPDISQTQLLRISIIKLFMCSNKYYFTEKYSGMEV
jgi:hypothetical protein